MLQRSTLFLLLWSCWVWDIGFYLAVCSQSCAWFFSKGKKRHLGLESDGCFNINKSYYDSFEKEQHPLYHVVSNAILSWYFSYIMLTLSKNHLFLMISHHSFFKYFISNYKERCVEADTRLALDFECIYMHLRLFILTTHSSIITKCS